MTEEFERRLVSNEDVFRKVNEGIVRGQWPGDPESPIGFRCECARLGCNALLALTVREYERVRAKPRRFVLVSGHELPDVEVVVERWGGSVVVEKVAAAGEQAEAMDPRG